MEKKKLEDFERCIFNIDMVEGFVNIGPMSNKKYNLLVPAQKEIMDDIRENGELITFIGEAHSENASEFKNYPPHCEVGTKEAEFISDFNEYLGYVNTLIYRKNSINGMLNPKLLEDLKMMTNLKEVIFTGVCEGLCVMDFARTFARYMDELNRTVNMFVSSNAVDTFDAKYHNREHWKSVAKEVMESAGIKYVENFEELKKEEKKLNLRKCV